MRPSIIVDKWGIKTSSLLGYAITTDDFYVAREFGYTRAGTTPGTLINASGNLVNAVLNTPRIDYTGGSPSLLVESAATNLALQSENFNATWTTQFGATVNTNTAISPDGTQNADTINLAAQNDSRVRQSITVANSTTYTMSCFYKNIALTAGQTFRMRFNNALIAPNDFIAAAVIDLAAGTATYSLGGTSGTGFSGTATGRIENYGNGWYRVSMTFTVGTNGGNAGIFEAANVDPGAVRSFHAWGAQLETGSIATTYIPTTTASLTRAADVCTLSNASSLIGQTEGTIYSEFNVAAVGAEGYVVRIGTASFNNTIAITRASSNNVSVFVRSNGANTFTPASFNAPLGMVKVAVAYANANFAFYVNGTQITTSSAALSFTESLAAIRLGSFSDSTAFLNDRIRAVKIFKQRLNESDLANLTRF